MSTTRLLGGLLAVVLAGGSGAIRVFAAEHGVAGTGSGPKVASASNEAELAIRKFRVPKGWKIELVAAEPDLANPVAFTFDAAENLYVVETFRLGEGVLDIRDRAKWPSAGFKAGLSAARRAGLEDETLDADLACRTVADRERLLRLYFAENAGSLAEQPDRVRRLFRGADGKVTRSTVFADGFHQLTDGLAAGVLARRGEVWFANIPNLWRLRDVDGDGVSDEQTVLSTGYGVRVGFLGHDLHGLCWGPDGRLYFSIGDRGADVVTREGRHLETPDSGAVFRCEPDGANLELFATGLRNPQELVFDDFGNLWTGDNNSDGGDQARWTYLVYGGDCGWHIGWQYLEEPNPRGPWNSEGMWRPEEASRIAYLVPPLLNIGAGPSGVAFNPGTGLPPEYDGHFFMTDFRGGPSGIWSFGVRPKGAGYEVTDLKEFLWNALPTDVEVGPDGGIYWSDWVQGWDKSGKGRIYRTYDPAVVALPETARTRELLRTDFRTLPESTVGGLLRHRDRRVRLEAQFVLAEKGSTRLLTQATRQTTNRLARLHGLWGLGQIARRQPSVARGVVEFLGDRDAEVRGQAAKVVGDLRYERAGAALEPLLGDPEPRPRFFAAMALAQIRRPVAVPGVLGLLRSNADTDPYLRHAGALALSTTLGAKELAALRNDGSRAVRLAAVVALRRQRSEALADFLGDDDPAVVLEAARAIHDLPVPGAMARLAGLSGRESLPEALQRRVLNANLRAGEPGHALALAAWAADGRRPAAFRAEAVRHLAHWAEPPGRDAVTGLWRPLAARDAKPAREAVQARFAEFIAGPEELRREAAVAAGKLDLRGLASALRQLARDTQAGTSARLAALRVLGEWRDEAVAEVLREWGQSHEERLRSEALRLQARLGVGDALEPIRTALDRGSWREKQAALTSLASVSDPAANELLVTWLNRAAERLAPPEVELELLEVARGRSGDAVASALARFETSLASTNGVVARRYVLRGGDAVEGRKVFFQKDAVQCVRCHKAGGDGGVVGPNLVDVGARQPREYLLESILHPSAAVATGFENVMIETRGGQEFAGTIQGETETELSLNTPDEGLVKVAKAEIVERRKGLSGMPEGLADILSPRELRDLIEFLASLKGK